MHTYVHVNPTVTVTRVLTMIGARDGDTVFLFCFPFLVSVVLFKCTWDDVNQLLLFVFTVTVYVLYNKKW